MNSSKAAGKSTGLTKSSKNATTTSQRLQEKLYMVIGDITEVPVDCIVNAANSTLLGGKEYLFLL